MRQGGSATDHYVAAMTISPLLLPIIFMAAFAGSMCGCIHFNGGCISTSSFYVLTASLACIFLGGVALLLCARGLGIERRMPPEPPVMYPYWWGFYPPPSPPRRRGRLFPPAFILSLAMYVIVWMIFLDVAWHVATVPQIC
jgi:hypothetical protein